MLDGRRGDVSIQFLEIYKTDKEFKIQVAKILRKNPLLIDKIFVQIRKRGSNDLNNFFNRLRWLINNVSKDQRKQVINRAFRKKNPTLGFPLGKAGKKKKTKK